MISRLTRRFRSWLCSETFTDFARGVALGFTMTF